MYIESRIEEILAIACLWEEVSFSYGNLQLFRISNLKNRSFLLGQEVVQIEQNWVWSIPCVPRV